MNPLVKRFLDKLTERVCALIGSSVGSAASAYHVMHQAEQLSHLEDLARRYEAEDKLELAATVRRQISAILSGDPARQGQDILAQVLETSDVSPNHLPGTAGSAEGALPAPRPRRKRRQPDEDDSEASL